MIPKILHFCWFGPNSIDSTSKRCINTWRKSCPGYQIIKWTEINSNYQESKFATDAYKLKKFAFVADYIRIKKLYEYGGIYLDTDMFLVKSLEKLRLNSCFFGYESQIYVAAGIIGAVPKHPFLKQILDTYDELIFKEIAIETFTIPKLITKLLDVGKPTDITLYPIDFFYPYTWDDHFKKLKIIDILKFCTVNTYAIHLWNASWTKEAPKSFVTQNLIRIKTIFKKIVMKVFIKG